MLRQMREAIKKHLYVTDLTSHPGLEVPRAPDPRGEAPRGLLSDAPFPFPSPCHASLSTVLLQELRKSHK